MIDLRVRNRDSLHSVKYSAYHFQTIAVYFYSQTLVIRDILPQFYDKVKEIVERELVGAELSPYTQHKVTTEPSYIRFSIKGINSLMASAEDPDEVFNKIKNLCSTLEFFIQDKEPIEELEV